MRTDLQSQEMAVRKGGIKTRMGEKRRDSCIELLVRQSSVAGAEAELHVGSLILFCPLSPA